MEGKILINQKLPLEIQHFDTCTFISQRYTDTNEEECVDVESKNRKRLALAICPELQSELEKAKELLKESKVLLNKFRIQNKFGRDGKVKICSQEIYNQAFDLGKNLTTFLEGSGNKNK